MPPLPIFDDVLAAAARIAPHAHVTPVLRSRTLDAMAGAELHFKAEHLQRTGVTCACGAIRAAAASTSSKIGSGGIVASMRQC